MGQTKAYMKAMRKKYHLGEFSNRKRKSNRKRRVGTVARRKKSYKRSSRGNLLGGSLMNKVLKGAGAAALAGMIVPGLLGNFTAPAAGFLVGGIPGAAAGFVMSGGLGNNRGGNGGELRG